VCVAWSIVSEQQGFGFLPSNLINCQQTHKIGGLIAYCRHHNNNDLEPADCTPPFTACSINHQYCDMLTNAFTVTLYAGTGNCNPDEALYVETYSLESGKCYAYANDYPSIMVTCTMGDCPTTTTTTADGSAARDHRALVATTLAVNMVKQPPRP
jgi:hypothetical protein